MTFDDDERDITGILGSLQTLLLSTSNVESFLDEVARLACAVVEAPASCGITTRYDDRPVTVASSDERAEHIDQEQYAAGDGPCLHALRSGELVHITDQRGDSRWDRYRQAALAQDVRWVLSVPLNVDTRTHGVLNIYGYARPHVLEDRERQRVEVFAARAATALALAIRHSDQRDTAEQLEQALTSRSVIDQAIGVLMVQQQCNASDAFSLLRRHSQNSNRKLRDVAADVITRYTSHEPMPPPPFQRHRREHA